MKFHKERTATKSLLEGLQVYRTAIQEGQLIQVPIFPSSEQAQPGIWRRLDVREIRARDEDNTQPLEISDAIVKPRAMIVDELTRHRTTHQIFVPITGPVMVVVAPSLAMNNSEPDPARTVMVPISPGQACDVARGTWHTLPFSFVQEVTCLSIMHRDDLDSYHDVRDLPACGWVGFLEWNDF